MTDSPEELSRRALELDAEAARVGDGTAAGGELRAQAAALQVEALGPRIYPVLVCGSCFRVTGWTDATGNCDTCLRREQLRAAYSDPHGGWVDLTEPAASPQATGKPLLKRLAGALGRGEAPGHAWHVLVEPGETGPISPETGYEIEVARRDQVAAPDGSDTILIRFSTAISRFGGTGWQRLETTRARHTSLLVPTEFAADLPIEQISEAWGDYKNAVHAFNRAVWAQQSGAREQRRQADGARQDALDRQRDVAELLSEDG